jgi:hypothetical protein
VGAGWYVALERSESGPVALPQRGKALLFAQFQLEGIADELGLPALKAFFSSDPAAIADYFRRQGLEADADALPDEEWFDAADALPTVRALLERLQADPRAVPQIEKVTADLRAMEQALADAAARAVRFHIATGLPDLDSPPGG